MIHESTFEMGQQGKAIKTSLSLNSDVTKIFKSSNAKNLILTHFSNKNQDDGKFNSIIPPPNPSKKCKTKAIDVINESDDSDEGIPFARAGDFFMHQFN
jgi:ribonuclease BN (tRNA processing enzyme)